MIRWLIGHIFVSFYCDSEKIKCYIYYFVQALNNKEVKMSAALSNSVC